MCDFNDVMSPPITPVKKKSAQSDAPTFFEKPCAPQCEDLSVTISTIPHTPSPTNNTPSLLFDISNTVQPSYVDSEVSVSVSSSTEQHLITSQHQHDDSGFSVVGSFPTKPSSIVSKYTRDDIGVSTSGSLSIEIPSKISHCSHDDSEISANSSFSTDLPSIAYKHKRDDVEIFTGKYIIITVRVINDFIVKSGLNKGVCGTSSDKGKEIEDFKQSSKG